MITITNFWGVGTCLIIILLLTGLACFAAGVEAAEEYKKNHARIRRRK